MNSALPVTQIADLLEATMPLLQVELAAFPAAITKFQPAAGEWSVNEVIGHLIETEERGFAGRITRMLAEEGYVCLPWDPDQVACDRHDNEKTVATLLAELAERRVESVRMVRTLTMDQLTCQAMHPVVGILSVNDLLHEWVFHDRNHLKQIFTNLQSWVWPSMGNTQRFTTG